VHIILRVIKYYSIYNKSSNTFKDISSYPILPISHTYVVIKSYLGHKGSTGRSFVRYLESPNRIGHDSEYHCHAATATLEVKSPLGYYTHAY
jgi:hypothetical protein